jgi:hypothetical protein
MGFKRTNTRPPAPKPGLILGNIYAATDDELDKAINYLVFEQDQRRERDNVKAVNDQLIQQRRQEIRDAAEALGLKITETTK